MTEVKFGLIAQELVDISSKMRMHGVKQVELSKKLGLSTTYVNEVLNGKRSWKNSLTKFNSALDEIIADKRVN